MIEGTDKALIEIAEQIKVAEDRIALIRDQGMVSFWNVADLTRLEGEILGLRKAEAIIELLQSCKFFR